ncbi:DUF2568 domain-containing protein [Streptococcus tangpeifui]|uniref:DUF2568 domain-containing protein n=1 Tax=Streptococcus tangpeifui TaxID=2709400 RepID=UPI0013EBBB9D|nr:DUF2568 domain-containing protein [Streptococcus sp. ZJ373]
MPSIMISFRFLLEVITVMGLLGGIFTGKPWAVKIGFAFLGLLVVLVWSRYGAPKTPQVLKGVRKLLLESSVFVLGTIGFWQLYGDKAGLLYALAALADLVLLYILALR